MKSLALLGLLSTSCAYAEFVNGPGSRLINGGHTANYQPIEKISEVLIAAQIGENSTALEVLSPNITIEDIGTSRVDERDILKRQDNRPAGALKCGPGAPCIDDSCCGANGICGFKSENCGTGCTSNCNAKAHCGIDSEGGTKKCGLQLCCSHYGWCGTRDVHCIDPEPQFGKTPCQKGFGKCEIVPKPECPVGSSSGWRRIAYYAGWNTKDRPCDKVRPRDINTKGLTHLMYSFVGFNPSTFEITADSHDVAQFREFTGLQTDKLRTWVAVGGWGFNDPGTTQQAFSNMVATRNNREAFIKSLMRFMDEYGFSGADIDWEYPSDPDRGGRPQDKENLVMLVAEMKAFFNGKYGNSIVVAPDISYLQGFAPAAMEKHVDHIGFMAYDLHGPWDSENALGNRIRPHTDLREIDEGLHPLWFDGVDPTKVVLGIAYYGRSFTASSSNCPVMGCTFSGPGKKYGCTQSDGVLSNIDIRKIIKEKGVQPYLLEGPAVKELVFDGDQWVGYDDEETIAMKEAFARKRCLAGTMIWSIDYDSPTSGGSDPSPGESGDGGPGLWFVPNSIPSKAPMRDLQLQPAIDFDTDSCYNVAVIGIDKKFAKPMPVETGQSPQYDCREEWMLHKQNVYSRQRCNNGVCVHLYAYYFQKDASGPLTGHPHDWEHVAVWADQFTGKITAVSASKHGGYEIRNPSNVLFDAAGKPMVVYHKDSGLTHAFRFANNADSKAENHWGAWIRAPLIGHYGWPSTDLRNTMYGGDYGDASLGINDGSFVREITRSKPSWISKFDVNNDDPGTNNI